jgi:hypothetical protein
MLAAFRPVRSACPPSYHRVFSTPRELVLFVARMRELAGGKPAGFKLCLGSRIDFLAICKAMLAEGVTPDFIVVDGGEGGTGAAPLEYEDHIGTPLTEGLMTVHNALVGVGLRDRVKVGASGKVATGIDIVKANGAGRRLHELRTGDDDGRRLHPGPDLSHQHLSRGRCHAGSQADARPRRRRQDPAGPPLPAADRGAGRAGAGLDGPDRGPTSCGRACSAAASTTSGCSATPTCSTTSPRASCSTAPRPGWRADWELADPDTFRA